MYWIRTVLGLCTVFFRFERAALAADAAFFRVRRWAIVVGTKQRRDIASMRITWLLSISLTEKVWTAMAGRLDNLSLRPTVREVTFHYVPVQKWRVVRCTQGEAYVYDILMFSFFGTYLSGFLSTQAPQAPAEYLSIPYVTVWLWSRAPRWRWQRERWSFTLLFCI